MIFALNILIEKNDTKIALKIIIENIVDVMYLSSVLHLNNKMPVETRII